jgi:hypothetical protein
LLDSEEERWNSVKLGFTIDLIGLSKYLSEVGVLIKNIYKPRVYICEKLALFGAGGFMFL